MRGPPIHILAALLLQLKLLSAPNRRDEWTKNNLASHKV